MSGRRRVIPLSEIAARRPLVLRVDPARVTRDAVEVQAPCGPQDDPNASTFAFPFERQSVPVLEVVRGPEGLTAGDEVRFVSLSVRRSLTWHTHKERSGARRIMWYDENPAFDEPVEGEALLILGPCDPVLEAYCAPLGSGLLHPRYLAEVLPAEDERDDRLPPMPGEEE